MHSDGSTYNSDSDISDSFSDLSPERSPSLTMPTRTRRTSVTSVSTSPDEDAYVMVLQNKNGLLRDFKSILTSREHCDVTFLVGQDQKPVYGVRAIIAARSKQLNEMITAHEKEQTNLKHSKMFHLKKKLTKFTCASQKRLSNNKSQSMPLTAFDVDTMQRLMVYIHCGTLTVDARTVIGLLNAAVMFGFPEVRQACWDFALGCSVREDNLQDLFESAKQYSHSKITTDLLKTMNLSSDQYPEVFRHGGTLESINENSSREA